MIIKTFALVETDLPMGGTRRDKTNLAAKTCKFLFVFGHSDGDFMIVNAFLCEVYL